MTLSTRQAYGYDWECKLAELLEFYGTVEHMAKDNFTCEFDLKLNDKLVHCKAARRRKQHAHGLYYRYRYLFNLRGVVNGDYLILVCDKWGDAVYFIIPVAELTGKKSLSITSHPLIYKGWATKYRENWICLQK